MDGEDTPGASIVIDVVTKVSGGVPLSIFGVAMMRSRGFVFPLGAAIPVMIPVFSYSLIVAISGSSDSNLKFASMIVPPEAVRAVVKSCVWKPGGKLVDELLTSIHLMARAVIVIWTLPVFVMSPCLAVTLIVTRVALPRIAVTLPVASTVAMFGSLDFQSEIVASGTV